MFVQQFDLSGVLSITPKRFGDHRGFFSETWNKTALAAAGVDLPPFVQDNQSMSMSTGTLRGLHFQAPPFEQGKLVRCGRGAIFDVAVDIRVGSPTYGQSIGEVLSYENGRQLWIPAGFLHGFLTLEPESEILYKCTKSYNADSEGTVRWDTCGISWPDDVAVTALSRRDAEAIDFKDFVSPFSFQDS